jgi:hypothetical protein
MSFQHLEPLVFFFASEACLIRIDLDVAKVLDSPELARYQDTCVNLVDVEDESMPLEAAPTDFRPLEISRTFHL